MSDSNGREMTENKVEGHATWSPEGLEPVTFWFIVCSFTAQMQWPKCCHYAMNMHVK